MADEPIDRSREATALAPAVLSGLFATIVGCGVAYWLLGAPPLLGAEDAAIGFRYARNLAEGYGVVFNPGGEHVEGFTSVSWLLLSALVFKLVGAASLESVLLLLSLGMTAGTIALVVRMMLDATLRPMALGVGALWVMAQAGFYYWAGLSLMDVAPWALGLAGFAYLIDQRLGDAEPPTWTGAPLVAFIVVALVLTRPESMLVIPGALVAGALAYPRGGAFRRLAIEVGAILLVSVGLLTVFRLSYFGVPLPNTYYTKVSPDVVWRLGAGAAYVLEYLRAHPIGWVLVVTALGFCGVGLASTVGRGPLAGGVDRSGVAAGSGARMSRTAVFVSGFIGVGVVSIVWGGGDHYQGHRFLQSWLILGAVPLAAGANVVLDLLERRSAGSVMPGGIILVLFLAIPLPWQWAEYRDHGIRQQAIDVGMQGRFVGATLNQVFDEPRPELGLWMVGGASYAYLGPVKDLLGLNWTAMGMSEGDRKGPRDHSAFNIEVFWSAPPEVMIPEPEVVLRGVRCVRTVLAGAMQGLLTSDRFRESFEPVRIRRGDSEPMIAYARRDWVLSAPATVTPLGWEYCG